MLSATLENIKMGIHMLAKDAQYIYDNQMPEEPPVIEEWQIRDRMLSDYDKLLAGQFYAPLELAEDVDSGNYAHYVSAWLRAPDSDVGFKEYICQRLGEVTMRIIEKSLRKEAIYELESGDIDRSLGL